MKVRTRLRRSHRAQAHVPPVLVSPVLVPPGKVSPVLVPAVRVAAPHWLSLRAMVPGLAVLSGYQRSWWRADVFAGVAVAAYLVPQVMAYAGLVGVPPVVALWAALTAMVVYAFLGTSRRLSVGPESTVALLAGTVVGSMSHGNPARAAALAAALALVVAGWLALAWLARLGVISNLLSHPLLVGYLTGGAVLMIVGQLGRVTGTSVYGTTTLAQLTSFRHVFGAVSMPTAAISAATLAVLVMVRWVRPSAPAPLVAVVVATVLSTALQLRTHGVAVLGAVPAGLPTPGLPAVSLHDVSALLVAGLGVAVVAFGDNMLIGRAFTRRGEQFDANAELLALAGVHAAVGLMHGFPISSSGTRTALAVAGKARTQVYSLVAAAVVLAVLMFAGPLLSTLPLAALGAVVVYAATQLVGISEYRRLWAFRRSEFAVAVITCVGTVVFGILTGVGIAIALSVLEMVARLSRPPDAIEGLVPGLPGMHDVDDYPLARTVPGLVVYRYDAPLFFINAEDFRKQALTAVAKYDSTGCPVRWLVLNVEANMHVDMTAARMLIQMCKDLEERGVALGVVRVKHDLAVQLERAGLFALIAPEMRFPTLPTMVDAYLAWSERSAA